MKINNINLLAGVLVMGSLLAPVSSWAKKATALFCPTDAT